MCFCCVSCLLCECVCSLILVLTCFILNCLLTDIGSVNSLCVCVCVCGGGHVCVRTSVRASVSPPVRPSIPSVGLFSWNTEVRGRNGWSSHSYVWMMAVCVCSLSTFWWDRYKVLLQALCNGLSLMDLKQWKAIAILRQLVYYFLIFL